MSNERIGIYGGSFSPPHMGHVKLAKHFLEAMELDRLIIVPAGVPPHKKIDGGADGKARLAMCRAAFLRVSPKIEVSDFEALRADPCYTVDTLRHFSDRGELYMLCGSDMFLTLDRWRSPEEIFRLATVVCGTRVDDPETVRALETAADRYRSTYGGRSVVMDFEPIDVSSTAIRSQLPCPVKPDGISDEVFGLICEHGLYGYCKGDAQ